MKCAGKNPELETKNLFKVKQTQKDKPVVFVSYVDVSFETFYMYVYIEILIEVMKLVRGNGEGSWVIQRQMSNSPARMITLGIGTQNRRGITRHKDL